MKTKKVTKKLANLLYLLLVCVIGVGCNKTKVEYNEREKCLEFETKEAIVLNINTEGFNSGDVLAVGDSGNLVLAKPEDTDRIVGIVTKPNKLRLFIRKVRVWTNAH